MRTRQLLLPCTLVWLIAALSVLWAQSPPASRAAAPATRPATAPATLPQAPGPEVRKLTLRPSPVTQPALRYRLLPDLVDQTPGNAVPLYLLTRRFWPDPKSWDEFHHTDKGRLDYQDDPVDQLPPEYVDRILKGYADTLQYADLGARRRDAQWDAVWRERGFRENPLPYLNDLRHVANLLSFRARVQISRKHWTAAAYTLQSIFSIGRHLGTEPLLVHSLVQTGFAESALSRGVEEWIARGDSPNLYWPLTDLPHPFVDLRPIPEWEREAMRYWKPQLAQAMSGDLPPGQWPLVIHEMIGLLQERRPPFKRDPAESEAQAKRLTESAYPRARRYLLSAGTPREKVDAMPADQVVGTYLCQEYLAAKQDVLKAWALPYPQAEEQMLRSWRALAPDQPPAVHNPLIQSQLVTVSNARVSYDRPMWSTARYQFARLDRFVATLRIIEALRDYAAKHDGRPPERLDQVTDLPVPVDPFTGKPFAYRLEGRTATLDAPAPPWRSPRGGWRYELTFAAP